jgi:hypothetical protein
MPEASESENHGPRAECGRMQSIEWARPVHDTAPAHNFLDFGGFFATVRDQGPGLVFAIRPPIFCRPAARKPVSKPKAF